MTTTTLVDAPAHVAPRLARRLDWLTGELAQWRAEGLLSAEQSAAILGRYRAGRRFSLGRLLLTVGAGFVGVGLIWLVAANLDAWPPVVRIVVVAALWLAVLVTGEVLHERRASAPLVGALRLLAALAFGGTVFQAAQTLQVPAYEPVLVGVWSLGALIHAYAARAVPPLLVGLATGTAWLIFQMASEQPSGLGVVVCLITAGVLGVALGGLHDRVAPDLRSRLARERRGAAARGPVRGGLAVPGRRRVRLDAVARRGGGGRRARCGGRRGAGPGPGPARGHRRPRHGRRGRRPGALGRPAATSTRR